MLSEAKVLVAQLGPTLCGPLDRHPPASSVHGISQRRMLEWVPFPSPGDLPDPGIEPRSPTLKVDSLPSESPGNTLINFKLETGDNFLTWGKK